jgi:hypothetical protein
MIMKRLSLLLLLIALFLSGITLAQDGNALGRRVNVGFGLWSPNPVIMPLHAGMDFGVTEEISLGFELDWRMRNDGWTHHVFAFQFRGDYYFNELIGLDKQWDVYAGLQTGPAIITAASNYPGSIEGFNWTLDGVAGGRWYFTDSIGLHAEVGLMGVFPDIVGPSVFTNFGVTFGL